MLPIGLGRRWGQDAAGMEREEGGGGGGGAQGAKLRELAQLRRDFFIEKWIEKRTPRGPFLGCNFEGLRCKHPLLPQAFSGWKNLRWVSTVARLPKRVTDPL